MAAWGAAREEERVRVGDEGFRQWLQDLGLDSYADTFADNDVGF